MLRPRLRFSTRHHLAGIAIVAVVLASGIGVHRFVRSHFTYQQRAREQGEAEQEALALAGMAAEIVQAYDAAEAKVKDQVQQAPLDEHDQARMRELMKDDPEFQRVAWSLDRQKAIQAEMQRGIRDFEQIARTRAGEYTRRRQVYEYAASHPWLSVPADPGSTDADAPDLNLMFMTAMASMETKADEIDTLPMPPRLRIGDSGDQASGTSSTRTEPGGRHQPR